MSALLAEFESALLWFEERIGLLSRVTPSNFDAEVARLQELAERETLGPRDGPAFVYERWTGGEVLLRELERSRLLFAQRELGPEPNPTIGLLLLARAEELELEARMVLARGEPSFGALARQRFPVSDDLVEEASALAVGWLRDFGESVEAGPGAEEVDLARTVERLAREAGLRFAVVPRQISSLAAVAGDSVVVRKGARVSESEALRVYVHEVEGHLLPRRAARNLGPPRLVGTVGSDVDEEGRAIWLEMERGLCGPARRRHLAERHFAATAVRNALPFESALRELARLGVTPRRAIPALCRASRGGGLAREIAYLAGFVRVSRALSARPELAPMLRSGRLSIEAADQLVQCGGASSITTGV